MYRSDITVRTPGRGLIELTERISQAVRESGITDGLCSVFVPHTSASLLPGENWDPSVRRDLEAFMSRLAPDGDRVRPHCNYIQVGGAGYIPARSAAPLRAARAARANASWRPIRKSARTASTTMRAGSIR